MEINIKFQSNIPALILSGKFDGNGAAQFDKQYEENISAENKYCIIDFSDVTYLSSIGIRSILKTEKNLRARSGNLYLVINSVFVKQVLEVSGLLSQLKTVNSLDEGFEKILAQSSVSKQRYEKTSEGNIYTIERLTEEECFIDCWVHNEDDTNDIMSAVNLKDLGLAFGTGGFGVNSKQASESLGVFVSTNLFSGLLPFEEKAESDFIFTNTPEDSCIYVSSAYGFSGKASAFFESKNSPLQIENIVTEFLTASKEFTEQHLNTVGFVLKGEIPGDTKSSIIIWGKISERNTVLNSPLDIELKNGLKLYATGLSLQKNSTVINNCQLEEYLQEAIKLEDVEHVINIKPNLLLQNISAWLFIPKLIRAGEEKLLKIETDKETQLIEEWDILIRKIYSDCSKVMLTQLHGGYMSKTFSVTSYDKDGRRLVPTVIKISSLEIAQREENASRNYVEKFILNNSTSSMGYAKFGEWAAIRYNFLGITGTDSKLTWLRNLYFTKTENEISNILGNIYTNILKPWYGQPKLEPVYLYEDHTPLRLFPNLFEQVEKEFGFNTESETLRCSELEIDLPNPFRFLKYQYPALKNKPMLWYKSICHGDLNMQNILLDEKENIYIIDFSETKPRNIVSDFARLEPILKFEILQIDNEHDLKELLEFEIGLTSADKINEKPLYTYKGNSKEVRKAYNFICQLRHYADVVTIFETDIRPYYLALLEWTYSVMCYIQLSPLVKKYAAYSAALICNKIIELDKKEK